jgi:hypothetical protein
MVYSAYLGSAEKVFRGGRVWGVGCGVWGVGKWGVGKWGVGCGEVGRINKIISCLGVS